MRSIVYDREKAVAYAEKWALGRNPMYLDFSRLGGDCTNFASQCVFQGIGVMNYTPDTGWYYMDGNRKAPAWTGVRYFHRFFLRNDSVGPYAVAAERKDMLPGDIVHLMNGMGEYYHSLFVLQATGEELYVAAHTNDAYRRPLSSYSYHGVSFLKILGGRQYGQ